ncbi:MAG TPA: response regulator transcription factor [Chthoniobacteraceae bacterium]|jgi:DNA-binding NarL/FixJ family response regulator
MIRISLVEDDRATRNSLLKILQSSDELICLGSYPDAETAEEKIPEEMPEVILMDINLPGRSGIECVSRLKQRHPELQILMLTTYDDSDVIFDSLRAGASGYLLKRTPVAELLEAIREVHQGGSPMSMQIARKVVSHFHNARVPSQPEVDGLTKREHEILALLAEGLPYKQIASQLGISPSTVHGHLHTVYGKLHVQSRTEAVMRFWKGGQGKAADDR